MFGVKSRNCGTLEASKPPTIPIFQVIQGKKYKNESQNCMASPLFTCSQFSHFLMEGAVLPVCLMVKRWVRNPNMVLAKEQVGITFLHLGSLTPSLIVNSKQIPLEL